MKKDTIFYQRARDLVSKLSNDEKLHLLSTHNRAAEGAGLGEFYIGTEVARGYVGREPSRPSTVFPQPVGMAATFDKELMEQLGRIAGTEARAYYNKDKKGGLCLWGPTVDMVRDPLWGRTEEAYGEDPCLAGEQSRAYTLGMAGEDNGFFMTVPTLKHFCANNNEEDRGSCNAYLPLRLKYEYYYAPFECAIKHGGARSIMTAYNEINGLPGIMNPEVKTKLKDSWGLWFAVSDGGDLSQNLTAHKYTRSMAEAFALSLKGGCNTMTDGEEMTAAAAAKALEEGLVTWEEIDGALTEVLYARLKLGQLDKTSFDGISESVIDCTAHRTVNKRAASEQMVLLKNDGILPIKPYKGKIAVAGPLADDCLMDWYTGYWSYETTVLQGIKAAYPDCQVISDSLWDRVRIRSSAGSYLALKEGRIVLTEDREKAGIFELQDWGENWVDLFSVSERKYVRFSDGGELRLHNSRIFDWFTRETFNLRPAEGGVIIEEYLHHSRLCTENNALGFTDSRALTDSVIWQIETVSAGPDRAKAIAAECENVIYCVGNHPTQVAKECYDRRTLALNIQPGMTETLCAVNRNTVLMLICSYPYAVCSESRAAAGVIWSSHAGAELGTAAAEVISGACSPAGRLPLTWYRSELELGDIMDYDIESKGTTYMYFGGKPLYPFGFGLSYGSFEYSGLSVKDEGGSLTAQVNVKNTSSTDSDEVVQLYFRMKDSAVKRPLKKLCAYERVHIRAGETAAVTLRADKDILRIYDVRQGMMAVEEGLYSFFAGGSSADERVSCGLFINGVDIRNARRPDRFGADTFEEGKSVRIFFSYLNKRSYVRCTHWSGKVSYGGLELRPGRELSFTASSLNGARAAVIAGESRTEVEIKACDSFEDMKSYSLTLPEGTGGTVLTFELTEGTGLQDISVK